MHQKSLFMCFCLFGHDIKNIICHWRIYFLEITWLTHWKRKETNIMELNILVVMSIMLHIWYVFNA